MPCHEAGLKNHFGERTKLSPLRRGRSRSAEPDCVVHQRKFRRACLHVGEMSQSTSTIVTSDAATNVENAV